MSAKTLGRRRLRESRLSLGKQAPPVVTATTGSPTVTNVTVDSDYGTLYDFGSNGSITTTAGRARVLIIGGGSDDSGPNYGNAGIVFAGWIDFTAATHTVTVGARGTSASAGGYSAIGSLAGANGGLKPTNSAIGIGAGLWLNVAAYAGYPDGITGSTVTYAGAAGSSLTTYGSSYAGPASVAGRVFIFIPS